jgi:phosphatidylserine decarboxylase
MVVFLGIVATLALALAHWRFVFFFRDPERTTPPGSNIISPADGRVVYIKKVKNNTVPISIKKRRKIPLAELTRVDDFRDTDAYVIGIFMRPTDVHVNRAPISGQVTNIHYHKAQNLPMTMMWLRSLLGLKPYEKHAHHILQNERNTVVFAGDITVAVVQIAELYVRRIVCAVRRGCRVGKGDRFGMIRMGSQVDCVFPQEATTVQVKVGERVRAGETVLATY